MPKLISKEVYQYSELSEEAQEKARDWCREASMGDNYFSEYVIEDAVRMAEIIGIEISMRDGKKSEPKIYWSGFSSQGDGACFEGRYHYTKGAVKKIKAETNDKELIRISEQLQDVQKSYFYRLSANMKHQGRYSHSNAMSVDVDYSGDDSRDISDAGDEVTQLMRDFADWIYSNLEKEWDYQNSGEAVEETILTNKYDFNEDGSIY